MMNFDPRQSDMDFDPQAAAAPGELPAKAEDSVVRIILEGSGGPDNEEITDAGLRFVRHILSSSRPARSGFVPNFKDLAVIRELAREFIRRAGGPTMAVQLMFDITGAV